MESPARSISDDLLNRAIDAARSGDLAAARSLAADGLSDEGEQALPFLAFLGMIEARSGNPEAAVGHLRRAHALRPQDVTIACNLISSLSDAGKDGEAFGIATAELMRADSSLRIARLRGFLAQRQERFTEAVEAYEFLLSHQQNDFECLNNLGNARSGAGDMEGAVSALRRAVALGPDAAPTRLNLAAVLLSSDRTSEALEVLEKAASDFPDDPRPHFQLYKLHKSAQNQDDALAALLAAERRAPSDANIVLKLAVEYGVLRRTDDAERAYKRCITLDPEQLEAYLGLAIQYEHTNREDEFAPLIAMARSNGIDEAPLGFIEALELRRKRQFAEALACLDRIPPDIEPIRRTHIRATLLDRMGRTDEAFAAFAEANAMLEQSSSAPLERAAELRGQLEDEIKLLTPRWAASWRSVTMDGRGRKAPVFLVGFPRSGTTLLDTLLMGHPQTVVMEEQPPLNTVEQELGGLKSLPELDHVAVANARTRYFEEVEKLIADLPDSATLIDKSPLFLYRLPLIKRLFPEAKIILALRHPCDVVLSCFMSNFRLNSAMANFLRLEDAVSFYDVCFRHWDVSRALFDADVHTVFYEQLVENVEGEIRPLIDWLGLEWDSALLDHTATARSRGLVTTASYSQVVEPIYNRASGRWLRYRDHLEPVIGGLALRAKALGYSDIKTAPEIRP